VVAFGAWGEHGGRIAKGPSFFFFSFLAQIKNPIARK